MLFYEIIYNSTTNIWSHWATYRHLSECVCELNIYRHGRKNCKSKGFRRCLQINGWRIQIPYGIGLKPNVRTGMSLMSANSIERTTDSDKVIFISATNCWMYSTFSIRRELEEINWWFWLFDYLMSWSYWLVNWYENAKIYRFLKHYKLYF